MCSLNLEIQYCFSIDCFLYFSHCTVSPTILGADNNGGTEEVTVIVNNPTSLICEAYSYPPATITWLKDGVPLKSNTNIRILPGNYFYPSFNLILPNLILLLLWVIWVQFKVEIQNDAQQFISSKVHVGNNLCFFVQICTSKYIQIYNLKKNYEKLAIVRVSQNKRSSPMMANDVAWCHRDN